MCFVAFDSANANLSSTMCHTINVAGPVPAFDMARTTDPAVEMVVGLGCPVRCVSEGLIMDEHLWYGPPYRVRVRRVDNG